MQNPKALLYAAEHVMRILETHRVDAVVIGAVALAAHGYVRLTQDLDLGVTADIETLRVVASALRAAGYHAELREPDRQDPLGGVIDITGTFGSLQIVSFAARFPAVIEDALRTATEAVRPGSRLRIVPLPQLVALKLYAGGLKSKADVLELLARNPGANLDEIRKICRRYRVGGLDAILRELRIRGHVLA
jgi:hypothetical protein